MPPVLEERTLLHSVAFLYPARAVEVKWVRETWRDGVLDHSTPHRTSFGATTWADLPDPEKPFAAEALIVANVQEFGARLEAALEDNGRLTKDLAIAGTACREAQELLTTTQGVLEQKVAAITGAENKANLADQARLAAEAEAGRVKALLVRSERERNDALAQLAAAQEELRLKSQPA